MGVLYHIHSTSLERFWRDKISRSGDEPLRRRACGTYVFELKVDRPAPIAMDQATPKKYAEPYLAPDKPVWLVGLSFARDTRRFVEGVVQRGW